MKLRYLARPLFPLEWFSPGIKYIGFFLDTLIGKFLTRESDKLVSTTRGIWAYCQELKGKWQSENWYICNACNMLYSFDL